MLVTLALCAVLVAQEPPHAPVLKLEETLAGSIAEGDPVVRTETLDKNYVDAPVRGKTYTIRVAEAGSYTLRLRSYFFDAYLVLRDAHGAVLKEDDDGWLRAHSRLSADLSPGTTYVVQACALHGGVGTFEISLRAVKPDEQSAAAGRDLEVEDGRMELAAREKVLGPEHPDTALSLNHLAVLLYSQSQYDEARALCERALAIREKTLGPEHPDTAQGLNNLALLLYSQGK
jgi:tetratricopeptide (TPR) repeat protein